MVELDPWAQLTPLSIAAAFGHAAMEQGDFYQTEIGFQRIGKIPDRFKSHGASKHSVSIKLLSNQQ